MIKKSALEKLKKDLQERKRGLELQLKSFAQKDARHKGDWDTKYPDFDGGSSGGQKMEEESDELEHYVNLLPVEHSLESQLRDIDQALTRMKKGDYGRCEQCGKEISLRRLQAFPAARTCGRCK